MYFDMKNYLKSNHYRTAKYPLKNSFHEDAVLAPPGKSRFEPTGRKKNQNYSVITAVSFLEMMGEERRHNLETRES
jgi:hypothetical protein